MKYSEFYTKCIDRLKGAGIEEADSDVKLLFYYMLGLDRGALFMKANDEIGLSEVGKIDSALSQREKRIPLQHITGVQDFMGLEFNVTKDVLVPRFDTECLVEEAMLVCNDGDKVLDVCTGSGCIIISLMNYKNNIEGYCCDISEAALEVARSNAEKLIYELVTIEEYSEDGLSRWEDRACKPCGLKFIKSDLFSEISENNFDIIISNPPYIRSGEIEDLMPEVKDYDPLLALDGGEDGLVFYRRIAEDAREHLKKGGIILFEIGNNQGKDVSEILIQNGYTEVNVKKDLSGNDRVVTGRYLCLTD